MEPLNPMSLLGYTIDKGCGFMTKQYKLKNKVGHTVRVNVRGQGISASIIPSGNNERDQIRSDMHKIIADYKQEHEEEIASLKRHQH